MLTIEKLGTSKKTCTWVDKRKGLVKTPCAKPVLINAKLADGKWSYTVASKIKLTKGSYRVSAYGTDASGGVRQRGVGEAAHRALLAEVSARRP